MDADDLPPQLRPILGALSMVMRRREPAIRERVERLRAEHPHLGSDELAKRLIRTTRRRLASSAAVAGATAAVPGLGTLIALGTATSQSVFALEQETELVLAIAMIYGRELADSDERVLEALLVVGLTGGAVKLRDDLLIVGASRITSRLLTRALSHVLTERTAATVARAAPFAVGIATGASFDWVATTLLGRAAMRYYGGRAAAV